MPLTLWSDWVCDSVIIEVHEKRNGIQKVLFVHNEMLLPEIRETPDAESVRSSYRSGYKTIWQGVNPLYLKADETDFFLQAYGKRLLGKFIGEDKM